MSLRAGTKLGPYEIVAPLGAGGMGEVYRAHDSRLGRDVAIKVLPASRSGDQAALERFEREARAASALNHPNIVTIYDVGRAKGELGDVSYIAMELVEGTSLRQSISTGPLEIDLLAEVALQTAQALAAAHSKGIVHRDLKPENIFLVRGEAGETAKVLDFGIARFLSPPVLESGTEETADAGSVGLVGTVRYMSPERLRGGKVSVGWDLWALAVVSYEALAGAHPFAGRTVAEISKAVLGGQLIPISRHVPGAPASWVAFFSRALSPNPAIRPKSGAEFFSELERVLY